LSPKFRYIPLGADHIARYLLCAGFLVVTKVLRHYGHLDILVTLWNSNHELSLPMDKFTDRHPDAASDRYPAALQEAAIPRAAVIDAAAAVTAAKTAMTAFVEGHNRFGEDTDDTGELNSIGAEADPASDGVDDHVPPDPSDMSTACQGVQPEEVVEVPAADPADGGVTGPPERPPSPPDSPSAPDGAEGAKGRRINMDQSAVNDAFLQLAVAEENYDNGEIRTIRRPDESSEQQYTDGAFSVSLFTSSPARRRDVVQSYEAVQANHNRSDADQSELYIDMLAGREEHCIAEDAYDAARARWDSGDETVSSTDLMRLGSGLHHARSAHIASLHKYALNDDTTIMERWPDGLYVNGVLDADTAEGDIHIPARAEYGSPSSPSFYTSELDPEDCKEFKWWNMYRAAQYHNFNRQYGSSPEALAALDEAVTEIDDRMTSFHFETIDHEDVVLSAVYGRSRHLQDELRQTYEERRTAYLNTVAEVAAASNDAEAEVARRRLYYSTSAFQASIDMLYKHMGAIWYEEPPLND